MCSPNRNFGVHHSSIKATDKNIDYSYIYIYFFKVTYCINFSCLIYVTVQFLCFASVTLTALVRLQRSREDVLDILRTARKLRIRPSLIFLNSCIRALGNHNDPYGACRVMDRIRDLDNMEPDTISYNSLIFALVQDPWASKVA